jgi:hypothetical protein
VKESLEPQFRRRSTSKPPRFLEPGARQAAIEVCEPWPKLSEQVRLERRKARVRNRVLGGALLGTVAALLLASLLFRDLAEPLASFAAFACLPFLLIYERFRLTTIARDEWIVEQPDNGEFLVEAFIEVDGVVMGSDRGIVWFEESDLCFSGQRSWFRIAWQHIHSPQQVDPFTRSYDELSGGRTCIRVVNPIAPVRIKLVEASARSENHPTEFDLKIQSLKIPTRPSGKPTTLPPMGLDPEYWHDPWRNTELKSYRYLGFFAVALVLAVIPTLSALVGLVLVCGFAYSIHVPLTRLIRPALIRSKLRRA